MQKLTALVTGASSGIGEQIALSLQSAGYQVYAGARRTDRMKHLETQGIKVISLDVTDETSMKKAIHDIEKATGMIDLLINNAGYGSYGAFEDVPMSEAKNQFEVNIFGLARLTQLVIPKMRENHHGIIINISSIGAKFGESFGAWYHATKYAVEGLTDSLALELAPFGIKVIAIEPGAIKTEWSTIAADNLIKNSATGVYAESAKKKAAIMKRFNQMSLASEPSVIAKGILKILKKKHPKFRYAIGGGAKPLMLFRKLTSDRVFYYLLSKII